MNTSNNLILSRIFTQNTFRELLENQVDEVYCSSVKRYLDNPETKSNHDLINEIYSIMSDQYRYEYFYKNTILNKLLLGRHSIKTTTALTEIPISKSKADFVLINGKAVVYEIKTELDNFERLDNQIIDYFKAFSRVCVVTGESNYETVLKKLKDSPVGICLLTDKNRLSTKKEAIEDKSKLDLNVMFKILRKSEYESIIQDYYGKLPHVTQFNHFNTCRELFCLIDTEIAYKLYLNELKKRNKIDIIEYKNVPYELKFLIYFSKFKKADYLRLDSFLKNKFGG